MPLYLKAMYGTTGLMRESLIFLIFLFALIFSPPFPCGAAQGYNTGFRSIGVWNPDSGLRFDFNIWYPSARAGQALNFSLWQLPDAALNAKPTEGKFPLLIISHPSPGTRFSYTYLGSFFAKNGYIVAAPGHPYDSMENMDDLFTWQQLGRRAREIKATLDLLLNDQTFSPVIDASRIVFIGFGSGATTGLLLGGAMPNCGRWASYCPAAGMNDAYCSEWARERINNLCKFFPLKNSLADPRIKAEALIAPAFGMLFTKDSFADVKIPIMLVGAGRDSFNKTELHCEPLARILGKKASYLDLPEADAGALMSPCSKTLQIDLPELCLSVSADERARLHQELERALWTFFEKYNPI